MKHDPRHIILIPLLAIIMAACSDTPLPSPAPAPGDQMRPLSFTMPSATLLPATASRADETEEIMLWEGEQVFPGKLDYTSIPETGKFVTDLPAIGGAITVEVKNLTEVLTSEGTVTETAPRVIFITGSWPNIIGSWRNNGIDNGYTPNRTEDGISYYQLTITKDIALEMQTGGLRIMGAGCTAIKVTYTAVKPGGLTYDGVHTQFTTGTLIGCVIAYKNAEAEGGYEYKANSCWAWHPEGLRLTKLFNADNAAIEINSDANDILRHYTTEELAAAAVDDPEIATDPRSPYFLRLLDPTAEYAFFFYYPYVDEEILTKAVTDANGNSDNLHYAKVNKYSGVSTDNSFAPIVGANRIAKSGTNDAEYDPKYASWTRYPVAALDDYSKGDNQKRLENSDFMHAIIDTSTKGKEIKYDNATSLGELPVVMSKKMVTIDLLFYEEPTEITLKPEPNSSYAPAMMRTLDFDISTGNFLYPSSYTYNADGTGIHHILRYGQYNEYLIPRNIGTETETQTNSTTGVTESTVLYKYRLILPPQKNGELSYSLSFKINGQEKKLLNIEKNPLLSELKSGYYYKLRFSKAEDDTGWHLQIEDWHDGGGQTLKRPD